MAKTRVAINGFGRIGRNAFKIAFARGDLEVVAINDITDTKTLAYLLKHDSNYGNYDKSVEYDEKHLIVDGQSIAVLAEKDPAALPWADMQVDLVIESTGRFTKKEDAEKHITAGAKRVVISGPTKSDGIDTIVLGANDDKLEGASQVISNASCTTNSLGAVMAILDSTFGVEKSMLTTVHSYTASQALQDAPNKDLREGRNAAENIVPTTTGAAIAVTLTLPQLKDKFDGLSIRVPTPVVSISDITALLKRDTTVKEINETFKKAAQEPYFQGILGVSEEPLVSSDYIGNSHSGIVDLLLTKVVGGNLAKVMVWYDNEWGYSNRLVEVVADAGRLIHQPVGSPTPVVLSDDDAQEAASVPPVQPAAVGETVEPSFVEPAALAAEPVAEPAPEPKSEPEPASDVEMDEAVETKAADGEQPSAAKTDDADKPGDLGIAI